METTLTNPALPPGHPRSPSTGLQTFLPPALKTLTSGPCLPEGLFPALTHIHLPHSFPLAQAPQDLGNCWLLPSARWLCPCLSEKQREVVPASAVGNHPPPAHSAGGGVHIASSCGHRASPEWTMSRLFRLGHIVKLLTLDFEVSRKIPVSG